MDFSSYGEPSEEWTSFVAAHPTINQPWVGPEEGLSLAELRSKGNTFRATSDEKKLITAGLEAKFATTDLEIPVRDNSKISARVYTPTGSISESGRPVYIYFHGGGFLYGSLDTERFDCASMSIALNIVVVHVCTRHVDEAKHPSLHHDAIDAVRWLIKQANLLGDVDMKNLVIGGMSSGGSLAAAVTQQLALDMKTSPTLNDVDYVIRGQVLLIPWLLNPEAFPYALFTDLSKTSPVQCRDALGLPSSRVEYHARLLQAGKTDAYGPLLNPTSATEQSVRFLPKTALIVAGGDPLRDGALLYATKLKETDVPTKVHIFKGMPHHFTVFEHPHPDVNYDLQSARISRQRVLESISWILAEENQNPSPDWIVEKGGKQ